MIKKKVLFTYFLGVWLQAGTPSTAKFRQGIMKEKMSVKPQNFGSSHVTVLQLSSGCSEPFWPKGRLFTAMRVKDAVTNGFMAGQCEENGL